MKEEQNTNNDEQEIIASNPKRRRTPPLRATTLKQQQKQQKQQQESEDDDGDCNEDEDEDNDNDDHDHTPIKSDGPMSVSLSDPDVLDCPICCNPLTVPVFQCLNGHIACSSCCKNIANKCPSCTRKIGKNRCRTNEKIIESAQVSCCFSRYGCKESINYCKKHEHEKNCIHAPCSCPFLECLFRDIPSKLWSHMGEEHADLVVPFCFDTVFSVYPTRGQDFLVLQEEENDFLFILSHGNTIAIRCISPRPASGKFAYDLVLRRGSTSLKFKSFTHTTTGRYNDRLSKDYLLVPDYFYTGDGLLELEICIRSKDASS